MTTRRNRSSEGLVWLIAGAISLLLAGGVLLLGHVSVLMGR